jgi:hypothetical protein
MARASSPLCRRRHHHYNTFLHHHPKMSPTTAEMLQKRHLNGAQVVMVYFADIAAAKTHNNKIHLVETNWGQVNNNQSSHRRRNNAKQNVSQMKAWIETVEQLQSIVCKFLPLTTCSCCQVDFISIR